MITYTARDFNQRINEAKKFSNKEMVFVTDHGKPTHVLMSIDHYQKLQGKSKNIVQLIGMKKADDIDFEPSKMGSISKPVEF